MEIEGMIIRDLGETGGVSKAGNQWKKHEWVLETIGNYPRKVKFHVFGDKADTLMFELGKTYVVSVDVESREFNERWYTDVSAYASHLSEQPGQVQPQNPYSQPAAPAFASQSDPSSPVPGQNPFAGNGVDFSADSPDSTEDLPF